VPDSAAWFDDEPDGTYITLANSHKTVNSYGRLTLDGGSETGSKTNWSILADWTRDFCNDMDSSFNSILCSSVIDLEDSGELIVSTKFRDSSCWLGVEEGNIS
jgi:hypothetical protein